jgi:energy-converting hydrogenase Eha subunit F
MRRIIFVLACLCLALLGILGLKIGRRLQMQTLEVRPPKLTFRAARQMFPFSVIPGGVLDTRELADSISHDPVVREHYRDLQPEHMWFTRMKKPMLAYVSYRKGNSVHWTTHQVTIPANELVLTDGKSMVRARCGNRVEVKRPEPLPATITPPEIPPPDIALETGLPDLVPPTIDPPRPPGTQIAQNTPPGGRVSSPPPTWCCGIVNHPLPSVPEPGTFVLVFAGVLGIAIFGRKLF